MISVPPLPPPPPPPKPGPDEGDPAAPETVTVLVLFSVRLELVAPDKGLLLKYHW